MITIDYVAQRKRIDETIRKIQPYKGQLTKQQYKTLIGQCKRGDTEPALKGLNKILRRLNNAN